MKKTTHILCMLFVVSIFFACNKLPANGDLEGFWQVTAIQYKNNETYDESVPMKNRKIFWTFQQQLLSIQAYTQPAETNITGETLARFKYSGNTIELNELYVHFRDTDSLLTDPNTKLLEGIGITGNKASFTIEKLNDDNMVLSSDFARILFRKF